MMKRQDSRRVKRPAFRRDRNSITTCGWASVVLAAIGITLFAATATAASFTSVKNGYWDDPCTWSVGCNAGTPGSNDDVAISAPVTVRFGTGCHDLSVLANAVLTTNGTVTVAGSAANNGTITGSSTFGLQFTASAAGTSHSLSGAGAWNAVVALNSGANVLAQNTVTVAGGLVVASNSTFNTNGFNVTVGGQLTNNGTIAIGSATLTCTGTSLNNTATFAGSGEVVLAPSGGAMDFGHGSSSFDPALRVASGTVTNTSIGTVNSSFTVDGGAAFNFNGGALQVNGNVLVNGSIGSTNAPSHSGTLLFEGSTFTNNGSVSVDFLDFSGGSAPGPVSQSIGGTGTWSPATVKVGATGQTAVLLTVINDLTIACDEFDTAAGNVVALGTHTLTFTGATAFSNFGAFTGKGLVKFQPASGVATFGNTAYASQGFEASLEIASGQVKAAGQNVGGNVTVDAGAKLSLWQQGMAVLGSITNNGTIDVLSSSYSPSLGVEGSGFTNNGTVAGNVYVTFMAPLIGSSIAQTVGGSSGSWSNARLYIDQSSTTTLKSDVTFAGSEFYLAGSLNTGSFTFTMPCASTWSGDGETVGNVRRVYNGCTTAAAFGNPRTTIQFTSGTVPPSVTMNIALTQPTGFSHAVARTYTITPSAAAGWTAILRLHYLDSELNANDESAVDLWRFDGTTWTDQGATTRDSTNNFVDRSGVTAFSPWTISSTTPDPAAPATPTPTPTATPAATPPPSPTPTSTPSATATATPTPTPTPTATATPSATPRSTPPSQLLNLSTRKQVGTADNVLIGGFIVVGTDDKKVLLRGIGPSLPVNRALADPTIELHDSTTKLLAFNDNWKDASNASEIASILPPSNDAESAILISLAANPPTEGGAGYTGVLAGKGGTTGIGLLEIYDLNTAANAKLANISTRGFVGVGDDLLIGGFIPGPSDRAPLKVLVRALGPSLTAQGVSGALQDPLLELHDANGTLLVNDNWRDAPTAAEIAATLPPPDDRESAMIITLGPSNSGYTAVVRGANNTTGVALVEIYALSQN